jgi:hypothetical protein
MDMIHSIRCLFLLTFGLANQTFANKIAKEQETLLKLSDIAIKLYAAEFALLRVKKAGELYKTKLAAAYLGIEVLVRKIVISFAIGNEQQQYLQMIHAECSRFSYCNITG